MGAHGRVAKCPLMTAGSRRNTCVTLTKRSSNCFRDPRLPAMPKLRFLGRS